MSKFDNSSFHREGKPNITTATPATPPPAKKKDSAFIQELVETGRANWKKAPPELKTRYQGIFLVLCSIPLIIFPSIELYRRLEGKSVKKIRQGELLDHHQVREFSEEEKWREEKNSLMYKIFGKDFFLDGFTSKTMAEPEEKK